MIPIGDEPNAKQTPWVNYALIAANVVVFIATATWEQTERVKDLFERWGYVPSRPSLETLFSSMFLHGGIMHIVGNMLYLWIFGDNCEARLGRIPYLLVYLATGAVAGLTYGFVHPDSTIPCVGASGAVSGVLGIYFLAFPQNRVKVLFWWWFFIRVFHVKARWIIGFWFVVNDLLPILFQTYLLGDMTAHEAHVGGFVAGFVLYLLLKPLVKAKEEEFATGPGFSAGAGAPVGWGSTGGAYAGGRTAPSGWGGVEAPGHAEEALSDDDAILFAWRMGRFAPAAERFAKGLRFGRVAQLPEPEFFRVCAFLYDRAQWDDARRAFHAFLDAFPSSRNAPAAAFALGMIYSRQDRDAEKAKPWLEQAARRHPDAKVRSMAEHEVLAIRYRR